MTSQLSEESGNMHHRVFIPKCSLVTKPEITGALNLATLVNFRLGSINLKIRPLRPVTKSCNGGHP